VFKLSYGLKNDVSLTPVPLIKWVGGTEEPVIKTEGPIKAVLDVFCISSIVV
jgi:hypothetical protein